MVLMTQPLDTLKVTSTQTDYCAAAARAWRLSNCLVVR